MRHCAPKGHGHKPGRADGVTPRKHSCTGSKFVVITVASTRKPTIRILCSSLFASKRGRLRYWPRRRKTQRRWAGRDLPIIGDERMSFLSSQVCPLRRMSCKDSICWLYLSWLCSCCWPAEVKTPRNLHLLPHHHLPRRTHRCRHPLTRRCQRRPPLPYRRRQIRRFPHPRKNLNR